LLTELAQLVPGLTSWAEPQGLLTVEQTAEGAQVSQKTIRRRIDAGEIAAYRIGTRVRIDPAELKRYLSDFNTVDVIQAASRRRTAPSSDGRNLVARAFRQLENPQEIPR
jgi:excisionase family DNA binding protein